MQITKSLFGRKLGLGPLGEIVINRANGQQEIVGQSATVQVTSAQVLDLFTTPISIIPAADAGFANIPTKVAIYKPAGTAYAAVAGDLVLKYTNAAGQQITALVETAGFLDQATAQTRLSHHTAATGATASDITPVAAAPVVLHMLTSNVTTGTSDLFVRVWYDTVKVAFGLTD